MFVRQQEAPTEWTWCRNSVFERLGVFALLSASRSLDSCLLTQLGDVIGDDRTAAIIAKLTNFSIQLSRIVACLLSKTMREVRRIRRELAWARCVHRWARRPLQE